MHFSRRRPTEGEQQASWPLLVSMVTLIAGVVILAIASLRSPDIPWMAMVGLQSLETASEDEPTAETSSQPELAEVARERLGHLRLRRRRAHLAHGWGSG